MTYRIHGHEITWARFGLDFWQERAASPALHGSVRVAACAYARPRANGHVTFQTGDLRAALMVVDFETGEVQVPEERSVRRYVAHAVKLGLLAEGSTVRCLRLPAGAAEVGIGSPHAPCPVCGPIK